MIALLLLLTVLAQVGPGPVLLQPAPAPAPQAQTQTQSPDSFGVFLYDSSGVAASHLANDGFGALDQIWGLPDTLALSRARANTVDQPRAAELNGALSGGLISGLVAFGLALVLLVKVLSLLRGEEPNPMAAISAMLVVGLGGLAATWNRWLQGFPIDLVNVLLTTVSSATLHQFAGPAMHVPAGVPPVVGAVHALIYLLVLFGLTVVLFIEGAWCILLGAGMGLWLFGCVLPFFGAPSQFIVKRWMGSLFSPVLVFMALRLAAPATNELSQTGAPAIGVQFLSIVFVVLAWQVPGFVVGAIAVAFPNVASMYLASRLFGFGRFTERMLPRGGGGGGGGASAGPDIGVWQPRVQPNTTAASNKYGMSPA